MRGAQASLRGAAGCGGLAGEASARSVLYRQALMLSTIMVCPGRPGGLVRCCSVCAVLWCSFAARRAGAGGPERCVCWCKESGDAGGRFARAGFMHVAGQAAMAIRHPCLSVLMLPLVVRTRAPVCASQSSEHADAGALTHAHARCHAR